MSASDQPHQLPLRHADSLPKDASTDAFSPPPESLSESEHPRLRVIFPDPQTIPTTEPTVDAATTAACRRIGPYEVLAEIARGGMGMVFKVRDPRLGRVVALKMIRGGSFCNPEELRRFQREAQVQAQVTHPHLLPVLDVGDHEGEQYFTMPYVPCGTAAKRLQEFVGQPAKAVPLVEKVARAVAYAHRQGILHRDLKPSNILLDEHGEPLVADFGLAKQTDSSEQLTRSNQMIGTPPYMAPEQADTHSMREITPQTDVWSLGVVLYELLTGKLPFPGKNNTEIFTKVCRQEPPPPRRYVVGLDPALEKIILRCLEKEPAWRYPCAADLADDLAKWQKGEKVSPPPLPLAVRLRRTLDRWPVLKLLGAAVLVLALVLILWLALPPRAVDKAPAGPHASETRPPEMDYWARVREDLRQKKKVTLIAPYSNPVKIGKDLGGLPYDVRVPEQEQTHFFVSAKTPYRLELLPPGVLPQRYRIRMELLYDLPLEPTKEKDYGIVGFYALSQRLTLKGGAIADTFVSVTIGRHDTVIDEYQNKPEFVSLCYLFGHFKPITTLDRKLEEKSWNANEPVPPTEETRTRPRRWRTLVMEVRPSEVKVILDDKELFAATPEEILPSENDPDNPLPITRKDVPNAFPPEGGFGLYVHAARVFVRSLVIEPLDP